MTTTTTTANRASHEVARAVDNDALQSIGRIGWAAKGVVYAVFGLLALQIALGTSSGEADPNGAVQQIAAEGPGRAVLIALAAGLALYAMWRLVCAALPGEWGPKHLVARAGYLGSGITYGVLCATAISFASAGGRTSSSGEPTDSKVQKLSADLLAESWGRWLVGLVGLVVIGVGVGFAVYGLKRKDEEQLDKGRMRHTVERLVHLLGPVGWTARAVVTGVVGVFLLYAALTHDPEQAQGFDGALRQLTTSGWAPLVAATGVGLMVYGAYCLVSAPYRVLRAP